MDRDLSWRSQVHPYWTLIKMGGVLNYAPLYYLDLVIPKKIPWLLPCDNNSIFNAHLLNAGHKSAILFMVLQV